MIRIVPSLAVEDVTQTVEFYTHVLGFELASATGRGGVMRARVRLGPVELMFRSATGEAPLPATYDPDRPVLHFYVEDVHALYERVQGRVKIVRHVERTLFGHDDFVIEDPDGMVLIFSEPYQTPIYGR